MKRFLIALFGLAIIGFYSFRTMNSRFADVLGELGIPPATAKDIITRSVIGAYFSQPSSKTFKTYPAGKRAQAVQQLGIFVKNYLMSAEFQKRYQDNYNQMKPPMPQSLEAMLEAQIKKYKEMIKNNEESYKKMADEYKPQIKEAIVRLKDDLKSYEDKSHPKHAQQVASFKMQHDGEMQYYNQRLAKLDAQYPQDIKMFIKNRLEEFLKMSADIDFNAELKQDGRLKRFVDPAYEGKSMNWKYCFRAGKETVDAARAFAQQWLKELQ